jgi:FKBP-type peptidyl-prolyl cis-trans isomerase
MKRARSNQSDFARLLIKHKNKPRHVKSLIEIADKEELDACCKAYYKALKSIAQKKPRVAAFLKEHKKAFQVITDKKTSSDKKRKFMKNQAGGDLDFYPTRLIDKIYKAGKSQSPEQTMKVLTGFSRFLKGVDAGKGVKNSLIEAITGNDAKK